MVGDTNLDTILRAGW